MTSRAEMLGISKAAEIEGVSKRSGKPQQKGIVDDIFEHKVSFSELNSSYIILASCNQFLNRRYSCSSKLLYRVGYKPAGYITRPL